MASTLIGVLRASRSVPVAGFVVDGVPLTFAAESLATAAFAGAGVAAAGAAASVAALPSTPGCGVATVASTAAGASAWATWPSPVYTKKPEAMATEATPMLNFRSDQRV